MSVATPKERSSVNARRATADPETSSTTEMRPRPWIRSAPAVWNSTDSSASRSHSRRGAIAASSFRRSSESRIPLEREQPPLVLHAARAVRAKTRRGNHTVARNEDRQRVLGAERPGCARRAGASGQRSQLAIGDNLASRDALQGARELLLERCPLMLELDVVERDLLAGEVRDPAVPGPLGIGGSLAG